MTDFELRPIQPADNQAVAQIIREVMATFGAVGDGFSSADAEVDFMFENYDNPRSKYYVLENSDGKLVGCGGIAPLKDGDADTCELKKMYFYPEARGFGLGELMLRRLLEDARKIGFSKMYLESLAKMDKAVRLYEKLGFEKLPGNLGNTGHTSCGLFYLKNL